MYILSLKEKKKTIADFHKVEQAVLKIPRKAIKPSKMMEMTISIAKFSRFLCMCHYSEHTTKGPVCYHLAFYTGIISAWYNRHEEL